MRSNRLYTNFKICILMIFTALTVGCYNVGENDCDVLSETDSVIIVQETYPIETSIAENADNLNYTENFNDFKSNIAVIGDSIAYGYDVYNKLPSNHVFAKPGVSLNNVNDTTFSSDYGELYVTEILSYLQPSDIMISLGMNESGNNMPEKFAVDYKEFTDKILKICPESHIYVMGITPIESYVSNTTNTGINEYNYQLSMIFLNETRVDFINAGSILKNNYGELTEKYSGGDGIHLCSEAYDIMLTYFFEKK